MSLFPHRYDFLYADHAPQQRPDWRTEHRYPLSDRLIEQGHQLFGVRFGKTTRYALLDIDSGSPYHPQRDPQAIARLVAALEPLGITAYVACTSSYSGGLHLYFPFQTAQSSQRLAHAIKTQIHHAGFTLVPGQLELFPNPKPYSQVLTLFNGHRLPLQAGSYLLNADFYPVWTSRDRFMAQWHHCTAQNDVTAAALRKVLKQQRRQYVMSGKANKFLNDLNAEIEPGWTGRGQTNHLLGRIALRTYVFGHILTGGTPLVGQALVDQIVAIAQALPGYGDWCQHRHELEQRAVDWARCVEASKYYPYGFSQLAAPQKETRNWNQEQFNKTAAKITAAVQELVQIGLPDGATARFKALLAYGIGGGSLYRHKELWHPDHWGAILPDQLDTSDTPLSGASLARAVEDLDSSLDPYLASPATTNLPTAQISLFPPAGGNSWPGAGCDLLKPVQAGGNLRLKRRPATAVERSPQLPNQACFLRQWRSRQRVSGG